MKATITVVSILVFLSGFIWFLQGINILPGSFMTGDPQWAINGAITMAGSAVVFYLVRRRK